MRVRVKICGITSVQDALVAAEAGCDAIGLVFYPRSPRSVSIEMARNIANVIPPFIARVGVFVDAEERVVRDVLEQVELTLLQFHGDELPDSCNHFGLPYMKTISVDASVELENIEQKYDSAAGFLLDTYDPVIKGGTGRSFDWSLWPKSSNKPLILAGGLTPENVGEAVKITKPWGVDVSGGVEDEIYGKKNPRKIRAFINEVSGVGLE